MPINPAESSPVERALTIPPPVLGWNTKDPLSAMDPLYAVELINFFPNNGSVSLRNGFLTHVLSSGATQYTHLAELINNAGTRFLIAFSGAVIYNVTSAGVGTAITGGFATISNEVYTVNFRGALFAKGYSSAANSDLLSIDGTAATRPAFTGPGGDDKDLWRLTSYKNRLYALAISDASMWYGGVDAITGAMTQFDFQSVLTLGGKPWYIGPFAMTGGDITQEYFAVISEQGEVLLYGGDYPGSPNWGIVGRYFLPAPAGRKSFFNWGSDILIVTYQGLVSLRSFIGGAAPSDYFLSDNIATDFKDQVDAAYTSQITGIVYPKGNYLLVNFWTSATTAVQLVMNLQTRAWAKFTGQRSLCWSLLNSDLYFGGSLVIIGGEGWVCKADTGFFDDNGSGGATTRTIKCRHAFNYLGTPTKRKKFTAATPTVYQSEGLSITLNADVDYTDTTATSTETDTSKGTDYQIYQPKCGLSAESGNAVSIRIDGTVTTKRFRLEATKVFWNEGSDF